MDLKFLLADCVYTNYCAEKERILKLEGTEKMEMTIKFYRCKHCGKILVIVNDTAIPTICCGDIMDEMVPSSTDGAQEKHVPVIEQDGNKITVKVGAVPHPMTKEHHIQWIVLMTDKGIQKKFLCPGDIAEAKFMLTDGESIIGAYAFCNLHMLWKEGL